MVAPRLVYRPILGAERGFVVQSTAAITWDDDPTATGDGIDALALKIAALKPDRIVIHVHGYNNPGPVAEARAEKAWRDYFANSDPRTVYVAFVWPSEAGLRPNVWSIWGLPALGHALTLFGLALAILGRGFWTALGGSLLVGFVGYLVGLRIAAYYRDRYRAEEYGVPDLVEAVRALDAKLGEVCGENGVELSFLGHSMGAFVVTSAVRILSDVFYRDAREDAIGEAFHLANLVLVSPDIPVQALVSTRVNFLATSLGRFHGRFLFTNAGDVVLDPISTTANCPILPVRTDKRNARLGNVAVLPRAGAGLEGFFEEVDPDDYDLRLRTPHGPVRDVVAIQPGKPRMPVAPGNAFMVFDCTGVRNPRIAMRNAVSFPLVFRLVALVGYALRVVAPGLGVGQDVHSGYFDHPEVAKALYGAAEFGQPLRHTEKPLAKWAADFGVRILALRGDAQVERAAGGGRWMARDRDSQKGFPARRDHV